MLHKNLHDIMSDPHLRELYVLAHADHGYILCALARFDPCNASGSLRFAPCFYVLDMLNGVVRSELGAITHTLAECRKCTPHISRHNRVNIAATRDSQNGTFVLYASASACSNLE